MALRTAAAPAALRTRAEGWLGQVVGEGDPARRLAHAAELALASVLEAGQDRSVALDLLAADALITLALLHAAEHDPEGLPALARELCRGPAAP